MTSYEEAVYNLFVRNWDNGTADISHIDAAVKKGLITYEQGETIKQRPRV